MKVTYFLSQKVIRYLILLFVYLFIYYVNDLNCTFRKARAPQLQYANIS